jgi:hypothetical protein
MSRRRKADPVEVDSSIARVGAVVRLGRRHLVRFETLGEALSEAYSVSIGSHGRCVYVVDLARYYDGERAGFVVAEGCKGAELQATAAIVAAL